MFRYSCIIDVLHDFLNDAGPDAADKVVGEKTLGPPHLFQDSPEHPHGKQVEEDVQEVGVHEHVSDELGHVEIVGKDKVQSQILGQVDAETFCHDSSQEKNDVNDEKVLGNSGHRIHKNGFS